MIPTNPYERHAYLIMTTNILVASVRPVRNLGVVGVFRSKTEEPRHDGGGWADRLRSRVVL
jgi:hypothetical protein